MDAVAGEPFTVILGAPSGQQVYASVVDDGGNPVAGPTLATEDPLYIYQATFTLADPGTYAVGWTSGGQSVGSEAITVAPAATNLDTRVVSIEDFAAYLGRTSLQGSSLTDEMAARHIQTAEDLVQGRISYDLEASFATRALYVAGESVLRLPGGLRVTPQTTFKLNGDALNVDSLRLLAIGKRPAHMLMLPYVIQGTLVIEGDWGFKHCPASLNNAICSIAARDHFQRLNRQADVTQSADGSGSSYYDRLPTVATQAIVEYTVPGV